MIDPEGNLDEQDSAGHLSHLREMAEGNWQCGL